MERMTSIRRHIAWANWLAAVIFLTSEMLIITGLGSKELVMRLYSMGFALLYVVFSWIEWEAGRSPHSLSTATTTGPVSPRIN